MRLGSGLERRLLLALAVGVSPFWAGTASAQDSQWWTNQYGNRARLLGGAVIASSRDLSAVYYNPGGLATVDRPDALLTGYVFELDNIKYSNVLLDETELSNTRFEGVAGLIAGQIPFGFLGDSKLAYSYLTRHNLEYRFNEGATFTPAATEFQDLDSSSAALSFETRLSEYWGGLTWSTPVDRYGVGVSMFVASRNQRMRYATNLTGTDAATGVSTASSLRAYDYSSWRLLWKIGVSTSFDRWNAGLTITTPSARLFGGGDIQYETVAIAPDLETVTTSFQDDLPSRYASSWAIGAGAEYVADDWRGHFAMEWFDRVGTVVLDGKPFQSQTDSTFVVDPDVTNAMKGLVNVAIGAERQFSDAYSGYAAFYTDFTGAEVGDQAVTTTTPWNLWTLGAGAIFSIGQSEFTAGLTYKFGGRDDIGRYDLIPDDDRDDEILSDTTRGRFWRLALVLGFKLEFAPGL